MAIVPLCSAGAQARPGDRLQPPAQPRPTASIAAHREILAWAGPPFIDLAFDCLANGTGQGNTAGGRSFRTPHAGDVRIQPVGQCGRYAAARHVVEFADMKRDATVGATSATLLTDITTHVDHPDG